MPFNQLKLHKLLLIVVCLLSIGALIISYLFFFNITGGFICGTFVDHNGNILNCGEIKDEQDPRGGKFIAVKVLGTVNLNNQTSLIAISGRLFHNLPKINFYKTYNKIFVLKRNFNRVYFAHSTDKDLSTDFITSSDIENYIKTNHLLYKDAVIYTYSSGEVGMIIYYIY